MRSWIRKPLGAVLAAAAIAVTATGGIIVASNAPVATPTPTPTATATSCTTTLSSGASVSSALGSAAAGSVICLNAGTYTLTSGVISKASMTTVQAAPGVARDNAKITTTTPDLGNSNNVAFKNIAMRGISIGANSGAGHPTNLEFDNIHWTGCVSINQYGAGVWNTTFNGGLADLSDLGSGTGTPCADDGRFLPTGWGAGDFFSTAPINLIIENIEFTGNQHCTDGIEIRGNFSGAQIGPGNEFHNIREGSCSTHSDSLQIYGSGAYDTIVGNYFHDVDFALSLFNGTHLLTVTNNVIDMTGRDYPAIWCGWCEALTITHNTLNSSIYVKDYTDSSDHSAAHSSGTIQDNVLYGANGGIYLEDAAGTGSNPAQMNFVIDYNQAPSSSAMHAINNTLHGANGAHHIYGTPTLSGGSTPGTYAGWALSCPGSIGCTGASDGGTMGVRP